MGLGHEILTCLNFKCLRNISLLFLKIAQKVEEVKGDYIILLNGYRALLYRILLPLLSSFGLFEHHIPSSNLFNLLEYFLILLLLRIYLHFSHQNFLFSGLHELEEEQDDPFLLVALNQYQPNFQYLVLWVFIEQLLI